ncbi:hypothetical protein ACFXJ8_24020 [Nonomuraea sp. NPDC059194]|uniref:hypothetical protein n=1 Tax=Nonomuraea sp. NPDC059194 TaxID=3346764 RepID=UPI0036910FD0
MNRGPHDHVTIDADGRSSSGRSFRALADEHADFAAGLRSEWTDEAPLPYEEFSVPYLTLRRDLLDACERLGKHLRQAGDGQVVMAERNTHTEYVNMKNTPGEPVPT